MENNAEDHVDLRFDSADKNLNQKAESMEDLIKLPQI